MMAARVLSRDASPRRQAIRFPRVLRVGHGEAAMPEQKTQLTVSRTGLVNKNRRPASTGALKALSKQGGGLIKEENDAAGQRPNEMSR
jgi:hypothetical protein